jgi:AcrR family transcriptional regulator
VLEDGADPLVVWRPAGGAPDEAAQPEPAGRKAAATRERILTAAIDLLTEQGPGGVGYRTVAECAGLTITAPAYYFRTIGDLLAAAQTRLFAASKARYRQGVSGADYSAIDLAGLIDLTAVIFLREATEYGAANVAGFSLWLEAARHPALRPTVWSAVEDQSRAWSRLLSRLSPSPRPIDGLLLQCLFLGKLVRITATGAETPDLAAVRGAFARDIAAIIEDRFWL